MWSLTPLSDPQGHSPPGGSSRTLVTPDHSLTAPQDSSRGSWEKGPRLSLGSGPHRAPSCPTLLPSCPGCALGCAGGDSVALIPGALSWQEGLWGWALFWGRGSHSVAGAPARPLGELCEGSGPDLGVPHVLVLLSGRGGWGRFLGQGVPRGRPGPASALPPTSETVPVAGPPRPKQDSSPGPLPAPPSCRSSPAPPGTCVKRRISSCPGPQLRTHVCREEGGAR